MIPSSIRSKALFAAMALAFAGVVSAAPTQVQANSGAGMETVAGPAQLAAHDQVTGLAAFDQPVHVVVALKLRHTSQLHSFLAAARNPSMLIAHRHMTPAEFRAQHSPTDAQAQAVKRFLTRAGFHDVTISGNNMLVSADGTLDVAQAAFRTSFVHVHTAAGHNGFANSAAAHMPASIAGSVLSVIGLQNVHYAHPFNRVLAGGLQPQAVTGHNPTDFSAIYGGTGVTTAAGVTVGIITQGSLTQTISDLNTFTSNNGLATVSTQIVNTNGTSSDTSGVGEWNLDSQDIVGAGGGQVGKLIFYNIPSLSNSDLTADINKVVSDNQAKIINVSLGECETYAQQDGSAAAQDQAFQQAVAQGQTFSISTGDSGADECGDGGTTPSWPAASQYVVAVAGTRLDASSSTWNSEVVWNDLSINNGATGGSESNFEPKPSWQDGFFSGSHRGVADVAFDGSPSSGAKVIVNGGTQQIGGTSLAAPIFSGLWARVIAAKGTGVGFAAPLLYQLPASDFHDITSGNNSGETASAGYDLASGRGSLILGNAINDIGGGSGGNNPPSAGFTDSVNGLTASFTDTSSDSDGSIASRSWDFGDGATSTSANPSHTYASAGTYTVTLTVTDNDGATDSTSASVTVSGGGGGGNVLQNGVPVTGLSGSSGDQLMYTVDVPAGASNLVIAESGGSGDADLYVKFGSAPSTGSYDCRPYLNGNNESCSFNAPQAGTYYVMLRGYSSFSGVSLQASWDNGSGGSSGGTFSNTSDLNIPDHGSATSSIHVTGQSGNAPSDLQVHVKIVHTYRGDLRVTLVGPDGSSTVLKSPNGSDGADNVDQTYTVDASSVSANGTWKLKVDDVYYGDTGYLDEWSLAF